MTIKKRLFCSNILMIVVPAAIVAIVGLLCMALLWLTLQSGSSMRFEDGEDLTHIGRNMANQIQGFMTDTPDSWTSQMGSLESMTESGVLRIVVEENGGLAYAVGEERPVDSQLVRAAGSIDETEAFLSAGDRSVYRADHAYSGGTWSLYLFGTRQEHLDSGLKVILALAAIGLIFVVFLTILMTNRFLTRFVVRKIEEPLDLLSEGARRLGAGELDYQIAYTGKDEFAPVCGAFNEMAARLKDSVERTRRDEESRKELLAGISHDLRSPLTSIRAYELRKPRRPGSGISAPFSPRRRTSTGWCPNFFSTPSWIWKGCPWRCAPSAWTNLLPALWMSPPRTAGHTGWSSRRNSWLR